MTEQINTSEGNSQQESPENESRKSQAEAWCGKVKEALECDKIKKPFERMREDMRFARGLQYKGQKDLDDERYVLNMIQRHLRQREAALYAKNPTVVAKRRRTMDFELWDGDPQSLMMAQQQLATAVQVVQTATAQGNREMADQAMQQAAESQRLLQDYQEGMQRRTMLDKIGETMEVVWEHQTGEQLPSFKASMKHLVRRTLTTSVGYLKLGYHRFNEYRPEDVSRVTDLTEQVAALEARMKEMQEGDQEYDETSAELSELQDLLTKVTQEQQAFVREGLDYSFPKATSIIPDPACYQLDDFLGAGWVAEEFMLTPRQISEIYQIDVSEEFTAYDPEGKELSENARKDRLYEQKTCIARVFEIWDKHAGQTMTVCEGYPGFLVEPKTPVVYTERFWPWFAITFNGLEDEDEIFPPSDVRLLRQPQMEMNISRERLREHRDAARPGHVAPKGRLDEPDKRALSRRAAHAVVELNGLAETDDIRRILQAIPTNNIDPNLYEVGSLQDDMYKIVGSQEAVMGGTGGGSATESSIAESARLSTISSAVDELDDFLTEVARYSSHLLLTEMSVDKVKEIAGRGAVWPDLSGSEVARDLWLTVRAGSSGRPNKSAEIQNLERIMPFLLQMPGMKPKRLAQEMLDRLDDRLDVEDFYDPALPSMMALNRQMQVGTGDPGTDPNQQGGEGGDQTTVNQGDSNLGPRPAPEPRVMDPNRAR